MRTRTVLGLGLVLVGTLAYRHAGAADDDPIAPVPTVAPPAPAIAPPSRLEIAKATTGQARVALVRAQEAARDRAREATRDPALPPTTTGEIRGLVLDSEGEPVVGTTVIVTAPTGSEASIGAAITDEDGEYRIAAVAPAEGYRVTFYYQAGTFERTVDRVTVDDPAVQDLTMDLHGPEPVIDEGSTVQGITIDRNYTYNIPVPGRTFEEALGAAAGSQGDSLGVSFSGTTSLENHYYIDGDAINDDDLQAERD